MPHFHKSEPGFWGISPAALGYTQVFAEAVDHRVASFVLGDDDDTEAPLALFMNLPPGWVLGRHAHDCHRFEVVIEGSITVGDGAVLKPGDVSTSLPGEQYGPHMAGPEGVLTLEIFSRQAGMQPIHEHEPEADAIGHRKHAMIDRLRSGLISPEDARRDPLIQEWAQTALGLQPGLQEQCRVKFGDVVDA